MFKTMAHALHFAKKQARWHNRVVIVVLERVNDDWEYWVWFGDRTDDGYAWCQQDEIIWTEVP